MTEEEKRVVEAARWYVAAKRRWRSSDDPQDVVKEYFAAETELFEAVDKLP